MAIFSKRNKGEVEEAPKNFMPLVDTRPTLLARLRSRREELLKTANDADHEIAALDADITWLERHPGAESILAQFIEQHKGETK